MEFLTNILTSVPAQLASAIFIFMFGLHFLGEGLKNATQDKLKTFFNKAIKNRVFGAIFGTIITGLTQSSTAVTVMTIGFVNAGLMTLLQAASIIVGANIGTTLTGHMMSIRFDAFTPVLLVIGGLMFLFVKKEKTKQVGIIFFGFGLFFIGLTGMSDAMSPLRESLAFTNAIIWLKGRTLLGILVGAGMTAILQSSTASKGVIITLAYQGIIDLNIAMPIIFGMNIGTCFTALLSSIQANKNAKRAALFHLLFSVIGTLIFLPFINQFSDFVVGLRWPGDAAHYQVANAHTLFNIVTAIIILPFLKPILTFINIFVKEDENERTEVNPLDERFLDNSAIAFEQAFKESLDMFALANQNLEIATHALMTGETGKLKKLYKNEKQLNKKEHEIANFLTLLPTHQTTEADMTRMASIIKVISDIERIGDHAKNIAESAQELKKEQLVFSSEAMDELKKMYDKTLRIVAASLKSYEKSDVREAEFTIQLEEEIDVLEEILRDRHINRLKTKECNVRSGAVFLDTISNFERIGDHAVNISELVLKEAQMI
jgi:phosphate:Na+ symporter